MQEPNIAVGILENSVINFTLNGRYYMGEDPLSGSFQVELCSEKIKFSGRLFDRILLHPSDENCTFTLKQVVIGIGFHWEQAEDQVFQGGVEFVVTGNKIVAINIVSVEKYLTSVISSEMSATSSIELLRTHAIISRSWLMSQISKNTQLKKSTTQYQSDFRTDTQWIKWWDREDHELFDVCADDHCQRYQGITRTYESSLNVKAAVESTRGEILTYNGAIADTRFSKCCGGATERFENAWEPIEHPYLKPIYDNPDNTLSLNLTKEPDATDWIESSPEAFCNTSDSEILSQILNNYDQQTNDFFRWKVELNSSELGKLILQKTGLDLGDVIDMKPLERGSSGRIIKLQITGTKKTMTIGKELLIRKALSPSHLYSSAFTVSNEGDTFILVGAGWGHGVGLCQIGAAVMAHKGYTYRDILSHYFPGCVLEKKY